MVGGGGQRLSFARRLGLGLGFGRGRGRRGFGPAAAGALSIVGPARMRRTAPAAAHPEVFRGCPHPRPRPSPRPRPRPCPRQTRRAPSPQVRRRRRRRRAGLRAVRPGQALRNGPAHAAAVAAADGGGGRRRPEGGVMRCVSGRTRPPTTPRAGRCVPAPHDPPAAPPSIDFAGALPVLGCPLPPVLHTPAFIGRRCCKAAPLGPRGRGPGRSERTQTKTPPHPRNAKRLRPAAPPSGCAFCWLTRAPDFSCEDNRACLPVPCLVLHSISPFHPNRMPAGGTCLYTENPSNQL